MPLNRIIRICIAIVAAILLAPSLSYAQKANATKNTAPADTGTVLGNVGDEHGAPLAGAKVTLTSEGGKPAAAQTTNGSTDGTGEYRFEGLQPGLYTLVFEAKGLISKTESTHVKAGHKTTLNVRLKPPTVAKKDDNNND